jgi:hypothetical protein
MNRSLDVSLHQLAEYLGARPDFDDIKAIRADMGFGTAQQSQQLARISGRFGFEPAPKAAPFRRAQRFIASAKISSSPSWCWRAIPRLCGEIACGATVLKSFCRAGGNRQHVLGAPRRLGRKF